MRQGHHGAFGIYFLAIARVVFPSTTRDTLMVPRSLTRKLAFTPTCALIDCIFSF
jgi:hypothetical protein